MKNKALDHKLTREGVMIFAYRAYQEELEKEISKLSPNVMPGMIRWAKWDKEGFEKQLEKKVKKKWNIDIDAKKIYCDIISQYFRTYVQEDFMKDLYGYKKYSTGKSFFTDYGAVMFYGKAKYDGKYDVEEFLSHWLDEVLLPKYIKWEKFEWRKNEKFAQYWEHLYAVVHHYVPDISKEEVRYMLIKILYVRNIKFKRITDYEIIFE